MKHLAVAYGIQKKNGSMKCAHGGPVMCHAGCYAKGGEVDAMKEPMNMIEAIRMKRMMAKKMALGGMIENDNGEDDFDMDAAHDLEMVDGLEDHNDFLSSAPQTPTDEIEDDEKMKRSKMLGSIISRVRYGK